MTRPVKCPAGAVTARASLLTANARERVGGRVRRDRLGREGGVREHVMCACGALAFENQHAGPAACGPTVVSAESPRERRSRRPPVASGQCAAAVVEAE
jgi:hypothetical protein